MVEGKVDGVCRELVQWMSHIAEITTVYQNDRGYPIIREKFTTYTSWVMDLMMKFVMTTGCL